MNSGQRLKVERARPWFGALLLLMALPSFGCGPRRCEWDRCDCEGRDDCVIYCERDDCDLECSNTASSCGAVCGNDCTFECSDTNHCSIESGDGSEIYCHSLPTCEAECGANCDYRAENVSETRVVVGPDSTVECSNMALCEVECLGPCEVTCSQVSRCEVSCDRASPSGADGSFTCD